MLETDSQAADLSHVQQFFTNDLETSGHVLGTKYSQNQPFPHVIIDDFFTNHIANQLARHVLSLYDGDYPVSFRGLAQKKLQLGNIQLLAPDLCPIYKSLMGPVFARYLETISGYAALEADGQFTGAGLHRYRRDGFSEIHLDSNRHPFNIDLVHRVNLIVFLNPNWQTQWCGELVLWSKREDKPARPAAIIQPSFNRCVIFSATEESWHSVNRISCPKGQTRDSLVIYYFNNVKIDGDKAPRSVLWHSVRSRRRQILFEVTNRLMTRAKPYAPYLRWLRPNKFDGV